MVMIENVKNALKDSMEMLLHCLKETVLVSLVILLISTFKTVQLCHVCSLVNTFEGFYKSYFLRFSYVFYTEGTVVRTPSIKHNVFQVKDIYCG